MRKYSFFFVATALVFLVSSCTSYRKATPVSTMNTQVNFSMDDLEYIGDVTGTSTQSYVLGIPVGGRRWTRGVGIFPVGIPQGFATNRGTRNALYDALMQKPDADFILPISFEQKRNNSFLGSKRTVIVRAKAFKIKSKEEGSEE